MGVLFDKLNFVKRLEEGGFTRPHAETLSEVFHQAVAESVATKQDVEGVRTEVAAVRVELQHEIASLRSAMKQDIGAVQQEVALLRGAVQQEVALLRSETKASVAETRVWTVGVGATIIAVLASMKYFG